MTKLTHKITASLTFKLNNESRLKSIQKQEDKTQLPDY